MALQKVNLLCYLDIFVNKDRIISTLLSIFTLSTLYLSEGNFNVLEITDNNERNVLRDMNSRSMDDMDSYLPQNNDQLNTSMIQSFDDNLEDKFTNLMNEESVDKSNLRTSIANKSIWSSDVEWKSSNSESSESLEYINHDFGSYSSFERQKDEIHQTNRKIHSKGKLGTKSRKSLDTALFEESDSMSGSLEKSTGTLSSFDYPENILSSERMISFSSVEISNSSMMKDEHAFNAGVQSTTEADIGFGRNIVVGLSYKLADPRKQPHIISDSTKQVVTEAGLKAKESIARAEHDNLKLSSEVVSYSSVETGPSMDTFFTHSNVSSFEKLPNITVHFGKERIPMSEHRTLQQSPKTVTYFSKETGPRIDTLARNSDVSSANKYIKTVARFTNKSNPLAEHYKLRQSSEVDIHSSKETGPRMETVVTNLDDGNIIKRQKTVAHSSKEFIPYHEHHTWKQSPNVVTYSSKETKPRMETFVASLNVSNLKKLPKSVAHFSNEWIPLAEHNMLKQSPEVLTYSSKETLPQQETLATIADINDLKIDPKLQASSSAELISELKDSLAIRSPRITPHADKEIAPKARSMFTKNDYRNRGMPAPSLGYPSKKPVYRRHLSNSKEIGDMKEQLIFEQQIGNKNPDVISFQQIQVTKDDPSIGRKTSESAANMSGEEIELLIRHAYKSPDILTFTSKNSSNDVFLTENLPEHDSRTDYSAVHAGIENIPDNLNQQMNKSPPLRTLESTIIAQYNTSQFNHVVAPYPLQIERDLSLPRRHKDIHNEEGGVVIIDKYNITATMTTNDASTPRSPSYNQPAVNQNEFLSYMEEYHNSAEEQGIVIRLGRKEPDSIKFSESAKSHLEDLYDANRGRNGKSFDQLD